MYRQCGLEVPLPPLPEKPTYDESPSLSASDGEEDDGEEEEGVIADEDTTKVQSSLWNAMYKQAC